jgi:dienelactone hydrolase
MVALSWQTQVVLLVVALVSPGLAAWSGPAAMWDVAWARSAPLDVEDLEEAVHESSGRRVVLREVTYLSHEWEGAPIRIAGHLAMPENAVEPLPAMVLVTSSATDARNTAANSNIVALAIDRVGEGGSTGPRDDYRNWLDLDEPKDIRNGWMYHHVMSALRAVTYVSSLEQVRKDAIGISGVSRGGLCSILAAAVDDRIALAVPIAATGDFGRTVLYADNWLRSLVLRPTGRSEDSVAWRRFVANYDPLHRLGQAHGVVWYLTGAQDEFFPITSVSAVMAASGPNARLELIYDADHGYYGSDLGLYDTYNNRDIWPRVFTCMAKAIRTVLHRQGSLPRSPMLTLSPDRSQAWANADEDDREHVESMQLVYSTDGAYTFRRIPMEPNEQGDWWAALSAVESPAGSFAAFVEVRYSDGVGEYYLTSAPFLSEGFVPKIRPAPF